MTPRQLAAYEKLDHDESEAQLAALANIMRSAQHADKQGFQKLIDMLTK